MSASTANSAACAVSSTERPQTAQTCDGSRNFSGGMTLTDKDARSIYQVKRQRKSRHDAARLAGHYGITAKAIRDVWNHRTWVRATVSLWTVEDKKKYVSKKLCSACCDAGVSLVKSTAACTTCKGVVHEILRHRTGLGGNKAAASTARMAAGPPDYGPSHQTCDSCTYASLRSSGPNMIWRRQDRLHDGLLQESLDFI
jgi:hypothetical protein